MIDGQTILAIIPARGGSKRLPRKNVLDLCGKPMIVWSIEAAKHSKYIDRIIVSTEDKEIASISKQFGAEVPFTRPVELAADHSTSAEVVNHALHSLAGQNERYDILLLLQPTNPLRKTSHIDDSLELMNAKKADGIVSVCELEHPAEWSGFLPDDLSMSDFFDVKLENTRSQDCQVMHRLNGAIYINRIPENNTIEEFIPKSNCSGYKMNRISSIDVDATEDFHLAELAMESLLA
jgi:CMP-N-acetylneuraminic acid synthetase